MLCVGEEEGAVGAARGVLTRLLAGLLRVRVGKRIENIFIQIPHHVVAAGSVAVHVLGHAAGAIVDGVAACEQLAEVGDRGSGVVEVGDKLAGVLVEAHLSAFI